MSKVCSEDELFKWLKKCPTEYKGGHSTDSEISIEFKIYTDWSWFTEDNRILIKTCRYKPVVTNKKHDAWRKFI